MKRIPFYLVLLLLTFLAPVKRVDVGEMQPVEAVFVIREGDIVSLYTDTGDAGQGSTVLKALEDMKQTTPAVIYLDTAKYLIMSSKAAMDSESLRPHLKGSVRVCYMEGNIAPAKAVKYLDVYEKVPKLKQWKPGDELPVLTPEKIIEKNQK